MTDHVFIVNPIAGKTDRTEVISNMVKQISVTGNTEVYTTTASRDAVRFVCERVKSASHPVRFYACGGDGTFYDTLNGLNQAKRMDIPIGIIPTGSGNDFIKSFPSIGISRFRSIKDMAAGEPVPVDYIRITDSAGNVTVCSNIASAGFDADVCKTMEKLRDLPLIGGRSAIYRLSTAKTLALPLGHKFTVFADGKEVGQDLKDEYLLMLAANGVYYGGGYKASPESDIHDGLLNLILIEKMGRVDFARIVGDYFRGEYFDRLKGRMLHTFTHTIQIRSEKPVVMNLDGEVVTVRNPFIEIVPDGMNFILPA